MYYELDVVDTAGWINHIVATTNRNDVLIFEVDFNAKYLGHGYDSQELVTENQSNIYIFRTPETISKKNGSCKIVIKTFCWTRILTEKSKYGLSIVICRQDFEEKAVYTNEPETK